MKDRQQRLESKVQPLNRAGIWCKRLGWLCLASAVIDMGEGSIRMWVLFNEQTMDSMVDGGGDLAFSAIVENNMVGMVSAIFIAWWALRLSDAFSAIVDVIDELSETV